MFNQMMLYYGDILPFLEDNPDLSPATTMKLKSILSSSKKSSLLQVELASLIDAGEAFVKTTYTMGVCLLPWYPLMCCGSYMPITYVRQCLH